MNARQARKRRTPQSDLDAAALAVYHHLGDHTRARQAEMFLGQRVSAANQFCRDGDDGTPGCGSVFGALIRAVEQLHPEARTGSAEP